VADTRGQGQETPGKRIENPELEAKGKGGKIVGKLQNHRFDP
jgi:uncharacterized protein YjbJ (UPF0337 family)